MKKNTFLNLLPVVDLPVFSLGVVEGQDGELVGETTGQDFSNEEAVGEVHSRVAN